MVIPALPQLANEAFFQLGPTHSRRKDAPIPYTASPAPSQ